MRRKNKHGRVGVKRLMPMGKVEKANVKAEGYREGWKAGHESAGHEAMLFLQELATCKDVRTVRSKIARTLAA